MMRLLSRSIEPVRSFEWVLAFYTLVGGAYLFTPLYQTSVTQNGLGVVASILASPSLILIFGGLLVLGALSIFYGLWKNKPQFKSVGWFTLALTRFFQILGTILVNGFLPISWIYPLTLMTLMVLLWAFARVEVKKRASP